MHQKTRIGCCIIVITVAFFIVAGCGGGGGGGSSGGVTITSTVLYPTSTASIAVRAASKSVTEEVTKDVAVEALDISGNIIGTCTTGEDGTCSVTGLTSSQVENGIIIKAGDDILQAIHIPEAAEITAATIPMTVNVESSFSYAVLENKCDGNLAACNDTVDVNGLGDAIKEFVGNESPVADTTSGDNEALLMAVAKVIMDGNDASSPLASAFDGDTAPLTEAIGSDTVENTSVAVSDAVEGTEAFADIIKEAYYTKDATTGKAPAETIEEETTAAGNTYDVNVLTAPLAYFVNTELQYIEAEDLRAYGQKTPDLTNTSALTNNIVKQALTQQFRLGAYEDSDKAGVALGAFAATIPSDISTISDSTYDYMTAAYAATNTYYYYIDKGGDTTVSPATLASKLAPAIGSAGNMASCAWGGTSAFSTYVDAYIGNPSGFVPENYTNTILSGDGASCTSSATCITGYSCTNNQCKAVSSVIGTPCTSNSDCDGTTICYGAFYGGNGACAPSASIPTGAPILTTADGPPQQYGTTYSGPSAGTMGSPCGTAAGIDCIGGNTCSDAVSGTCVTPDYPRGAGSACTGNAQCTSGTCTAGFCTSGGSGTGEKTNGMACGSSMQCASGCCMNQICSVVTECSGGGGGGAKANGESCTPTTPGSPVTAECQSSLCCTSGMTCGSTCGAGSHCTVDIQCTSGVCNMMLNPRMCSM